jgi:ABC-type sulfate/molybdate transport systems ATPase subunit
MLRWLEQLIAQPWNRRVARRAEVTDARALDLGAQVIDSQPSDRRVTVSQHRRTEHIGVLGKTGSGKSFLLRCLATQDVAADRGFVYFDLHGDATPFLVATVAAQERRSSAT